VALITAEDVLDLPATSRVVPAPRLPLPAGSTTSVSVVIPAKNVAAYIGETLTSALAQGVLRLRDGVQQEEDGKRDSILNPRPIHLRAHG